MKRVLGVVLAVFLLLSMGSASLAESNMNETGLPIVKEKESFTALVATSAMDPNSFPLIQTIEEATNVHVNWIVAPREGLGERRALMWANNDLADVMMDDAAVKADVDIYAPMGMIMPINDLLDQYGTNFKTITQQKGTYETILSALVYPDGNIYYFPYVSRYYHGTCGAMAINATWLEKLNLEVPQTPEEFLEVLKAFKTQDPNGNGLQDEIPYSVDLLGGLYESLFNVTGFHGYAYGYQIEDGKVIDPRIMPSFQGNVKWLNQLYAEGLLDTEVFTQDRDMYLAKGKINPPVYGVTNCWRIGNVFGETVALEQYKIIAPYWIRTGNAGGMGNMIPI